MDFKATPSRPFDWIEFRRNFHPNHPFCTRVAPSPTGHLHLGHAFHLLFVEEFLKLNPANQCLLRLEDHDLQRSKELYKEAVLQEIHFFLPLGNFLRVPDTSQRHLRYQSVLENLNERGLLYGCHCTKKLQRDHSKCLESSQLSKNDLFHNTKIAVRIHLENVPPLDTIKEWGQVPLLLECEEFQDPVLRDRHLNFSYFLTNTVDDMDQGVNFIIRGEDLYSLTPYQQAFHRLLGNPEKIEYLHHPLLLLPDHARKFSKRDKDSSFLQLVEKQNVENFKESLRKLSVWD